MRLPLPLSPRRQHGGNSMADWSRLELLKQMGLSAWQGLKVAVTGVDVVIDPNKPAEPEQTEGEGGEQGSPPQPPPEAIGTAIGRRAMAAAQHRSRAAVRATEGSAVGAAELLAGVPLTLAVYPGAGSALVEQTLGVAGVPLPLDGDPEVEATAHDLAWLPLAVGEQFCERGGGRLVAVGGYRRAALVRFEGAAARYLGTWCAAGDDALARHAPADLLFETPEKLWRALEQGQAEQALLGGGLLGRALRLPGAVIVTELVPGEETGLIPVWGLFSTGRVPPLEMADDGEILIVPLAQEAVVA